ncbi:MAG: MBL fold metallo-hydrolase [Candidatus Nezhaarchaeota archaeon]|nr:MBL fold metallo-hydrolase [Candidatus Nezhaarchaeota archaeon]
MKLLDGLYCYIWHGWENNCNAYLIDSGLRVLIDPGHRRFLSWLLGELKTDGFEPRDIDLVINTHSHPDHCEADVDLVDMSGVKVAMHKLEEEYLREEGGLLFEMMGLDPSQITIHFYLAERLKLDGVELQVIHTPGHTPGSVCIYWPEREVLISGDLVFEGGVGRVDLPGGSGLLLKESIRRVASLKTSYLLPGHGDLVIGRSEVERNFRLIERAYFDWL